MTDIHKDLSLRTRVQVSFGCYCNWGLSLANLWKLIIKKKASSRSPEIQYLLHLARQGRIPQT